MTLTGPMYEVTLANLTRGWEYTSTAGPAPDPAPDVYLVDNVSASWGFVNGDIPGQLEVETATASLLVRDAANLPAVNIGDIVTLYAERPFDSGLWIDFLGRITDVSASLDPGRGVVVRLVMVDPTADLNNAYDFGESPTPQYTYIKLREAITSNPDALYAWDNGSGHELDFNNQQPSNVINVREAATRLLAGAQNLNVLRALTLEEFTDAATGWSTAGNASAAFVYFNALTRGRPTLVFDNPDRVVMVLTPDGDDPDKITITYDPGGDGLLTLDACHIAAAVEVTKTRAHRYNRFVITTVKGTVPNLKQGIQTRTLTDKVRSQGQNERRIETYVVHAEAGDLRDTYEVNPGNGDAWSIAALTVTTRTLTTDAAVAELTGAFTFPRAAPGAAGPHPIALGLVNVADDVDVLGKLATLTVVGATTVIAGGHVEIDLDLSPITPYMDWRYDDGLYEGLTFTSLDASAYDAMTFTDTGGLFIDPAVTFNQLAYTGPS